MAPRAPERRAGWLTAALLAAVAALWLPPLQAAAALAWLAVALAFYERRLRSRLAAGGLAGAVLVLAAGPLLAAWWSADEAAWRGRVEKAYAGLWRDLEDAARRSAARLEPPPDEAAVRQAFEHLGRLARLPPLEGKTVLLLAPGGEPVAWAGEGLLHEPEAESLPAAGTTFRRSYTAATLFAVAPLAGDGSWRLVVGRSFDDDRWPFGGALAQPAAWSVVPAYTPDDAVPDGALALQQGSWPMMLLAWPPPYDVRAVEERSVRLAAAVVALTLWLILLLAARDGLRRSPVRPVPPASPATAALLLAGGLGAAIRGAALPPPIAAALIGAGLLCALPAVRRGRMPASRLALAGATATLLLIALVLGWQRLAGPHELSAAFVGDRQAVALRLAALLLAGGLIGLASRLGRGVAGDGIAWLTVGLIAAAAAAHDLPAVALPLACAAGAGATLWLAGQSALRRPGVAAVALLLLGLLAATAWEVAYRQALRHTIAEHDLPQLAPPTAAEQTAFALELEDFFGRLELDRLLPLGGGDVDPQDLAFALWRRSPLPQRDGLSALVIEPEDAQPLIFSFDLPLDETRRNLVWERLRLPPVPAWRLSLIEGETEIRRGGRVWASGRYWFLPRPGFRLGASEVDELETTLLRGRPQDRLVEGLAPGVRYALYHPDGSVALSPWREAPPLPPSVVERDHGRTATPAGRAWYWLRRDRDGIAVLYLPLLGPVQGLLRAAVHGFGSLALAVLALGLAAAVALAPWRSWRAALVRLVRSYSRRLLLVYTLLLFVPLVTLNLVLLRDFGERQRQQQLAEGEAALTSARTLLTDTIRAAGEGFSLDVVLDPSLLDWISSVVHHEVNLYWQGRLLSSSQRALFTAGLLPNRVPGDLYSRLTLLGYDLASRDRDRGEVAYLEIYAPIRLGGGIDFVLSVPMLEQQEEAARRLAAMRRQAVVVSAGLFLLLVALGGRLARGFTTPLQELVAGTRRIAAGASSLDLAPRELELAALVRAIDDMARRIAEGRERLLREKQVVERMVENITSGVVSLDRDRRVLLHNRVAQALLATRVGAPIDEVLGGVPQLAPVRAFVAAAGGEIRQTTVRLAPPPSAASDAVEPGGGPSEPREWSLTWVPLPGGGDPSALLVVDDDTEVLRGQRLLAWAEMARIIAHEIKNPLTPIRLSAEHLREVYARDPERLDEVFERCTTNILRQVQELQDIASEFSIYSRIPRAELAPGDVVDVLQELVAAYGDAAQAGVAVAFRHPPEPVMARIDRTLLGRAVRNLLENALRASSGDGQGRVEVAVEAAGGRAVIRVADRGPGVPDAILDRIFEPYFSTHDTGTGLGLPIARRIVEEHHGTIEAKNRPGGGLEVTITMPTVTAKA